MVAGRRGRTPLLLDTKALAVFLEGVRLGLPQNDAASRAGWHGKTVIDWKATANEARLKGGKLTAHQKECSEFLDALEKAVAECKTGHLAIITRAAQSGTWQAAAWTLERRWPLEFGRRLLEVSGPEGGPIQVEEKVDSVLDLLDRVKATSNGHKEGTPTLNGH